MDGVTKLTDVEISNHISHNVLNHHRLIVWHLRLIDSCAFCLYAIFLLNIIGLGDIANLFYVVSHAVYIFIFRTDVNPLAVAVFARIFDKTKTTKLSL